MKYPRQRVLHVIRRLDIAGGAERIVAELVRNEQHYDVLVYKGGDSFFDLGGRNVIRARNIVHALWLCMSLRARYETFHLHLFPSIYFSLFLGKKSIIHEHNTHNARREKAIFRPVEWLIYRRARSVLAISEATRTALQGWIGKRLRIHVQHNFVAPVSMAQVIADTPRSGGSKHLVMVASFTAQKRQDLLIRAMVGLPEGVHVSFAGTGPTLDACKSLADNLGLIHRVCFLGAVSDVSTLYTGADLCVLVSHWEGFGLVVVEAAQFGVPTLVSDVEGLRDICPDPRLLFKGEDPSVLAGQIQRLLSSEEARVSKQELQVFATKFGIEDYVKRLEDFYAD